MKSYVTRELAGNLNILSKKVKKLVLFDFMVIFFSFILFETALKHMHLFVKASIIILFLLFLIIAYVRLIDAYTYRIIHMQITQDEIVLSVKEKDKSIPQQRWNMETYNINKDNFYNLRYFKGNNTIEIIFYKNDKKIIYKFKNKNDGNKMFNCLKQFAEAALRYQKIKTQP